MTLPRPVQAVIFDMDGLLVDTETVFRDAMMAVSERHGLTLPLPVFLSMVGATREQNRRVVLDHFGPDFPYDGWIEAVSEQAHAQIIVGVTLKAGVVELIDLLEAMDIPRAVATSSGHGAVERQLGPAGLIPRFQAIIAAGDYARGKPHPDPFLAAAARLGADPAACLALEDSHNGVRAAHAAGMMTIMVPDLLEATEEIEALCVAVAETLHDVRALVAASIWPGAEAPGRS
jgi:beta-phosphoglucomutase-like phosphatase (HAD superfamily)